MAPARPVEAGVAQQPTSGRPPRLRLHRTGFYELHTDVSELEAREAAVRMDAIAGELMRMTQHLNKKPPPFMPFHLYRRIEDYEAAGGTPGSGGQYNRRSGTLMAVAGQRLDERTWHRVQHEAFHQFAHHTLGSELPPWLNEGLAEYFAEFVFTGDAFVGGLVPPHRRDRIVASLEAGSFVPLDRMFALTHDQWNQHLARDNYDQAWSLVVFLMHGDDGRYRERFEQFLVLCSQGRGFQQAWRATFGNIDGLERAWARWWTNLPAEPTAHGYRLATARTLSSFWARAVAQGQTIRDFDDFVRLGRSGQLAFDDRQWLPPSLLERALEEADALAEAGGDWSIRRVGQSAPIPGRPGIAARPRGMAGTFQELVLLMPDGYAFRGRFQAERRQVTAVVVAVERLPEDLLDDFNNLLDR